MAPQNGALAVMGQKASLRELGRVVEAWKEAAKTPEETLADGRMVGWMRGWLALTPGFSGILQAFGLDDFSECSLSMCTSKGLVLVVKQHQLLYTYGFASGINCHGSLPQMHRKLLILLPEHAIP